MGKLVLFDIFSDFGFFKKPDINKFGLTYNLPPKSVILGIIGSILGMTGLGKQYDEILQLKEILNIGHILTQDHNKTKRLIKKVDFDAVENGLESLKFKKRNRLLEVLKLLGSTKEKASFEIYDELKEIIMELELELQYPEYYRQLKHLNIGIKPSEGFPFNKIMNKYNSRNSYFGGARYDNQIISEQLLIRPKYCIYVYDDTEKILNELVMRIKNKNPIFMPYLGKNEFIASFDNLEIITDIKPIKNLHRTHISSIFLRSTKTENNENDEEDEYNLRGDSLTVTGLPQGFKFLEHYPIGYSNNGMQYELQLAEFTAQSVEMSKIDLEKGKLFEINKEIVYLS